MNTTKFRLTLRCVNLFELAAEFERFGSPLAEQAREFAEQVEEVEDGQISSRLAPYERERS